MISPFHVAASIYEGNPYAIHTDQMQKIIAEKMDTINEWMEANIRSGAWLIVRDPTTDLPDSDISKSGVILNIHFARQADAALFKMFFA